jgi:hypothetical protein
MKRAKRTIKIRTWLLSSRVYVFAWCLIISSLFWFLLALNNRYSAVIKVPVTYLNMSEDRFLIEKLPKEIEAEISGTGYQLFSYYISPEKAIVKLDLRKAGLGPLNAEKRAFLTTNSGIDFFNREHTDITLLRLKPDTLYFNFPDRAVKKVPIHLNALFDFEKQFSLVENAILIPDSAQISGPKTSLDSINQVETEMIILKNLTTSGIYSVKLKSVGNEINWEPAAISMKLNIEKFTEGIVEVPVYVNHLLSKDSLRIMPSNVKIKFWVALSNYTKVNSSQFKVYADANDLKNKNNSKLKLNVLVSPDYVKNVKVEPEYIDYLILKK